MKCGSSFFCGTEKGKNETELQQNQDENVERGNWSGKFDYLLSLLGYAIGLAAAWRFPYLCYRNGGGAFLVPYFIMLFLCGIPLFLMETALGQFTSLGAITVYKISPIFKGAGYATVVICTFLAVYYNVIISYILFYFAKSLTFKLPWDNCHNEWNTPNCTVSYRNKNLNSSFGDLMSLNRTIDKSFRYLNTPSQDFFYNHVLDMTDGIHDLGSMNSALVLALSVAWVLVYLCLIKGVKTTGKVVYFTATFPYVVLLIMLIKGFTLPGAVNGIIFYIKPEWKQLTKLKVWGDAAVQVFFSIGPGWGGLVTMASFNRFHKNCVREAIFVPLINVCTAIMAGFVVFSILGYLSHQTGIDVDKVATDGPGLAFIVYPEALSLLPASPFWSCLFFFMLLTLGLDSQFVTIETVIAAVWDELPQYIQNRRVMLSTIICIVLYLSGLICVTQGGIYIVQMLDWYCATLTVIVICIIETVIISWIYGVDKFIRDIEFMMDTKIGWWWRLSWKYTTPAVLIIILVMYIVDSAPVTFDNYVYPDWAIYIGWSISGSSLIIIPLYMVWKFFASPGSIHKKLLNFLPSDDYGPALPVHYFQWKESCSQNKSKSSAQEELEDLTSYKMPFLNTSSSSLQKSAILKVENLSTQL